MEKTVDHCNISVDELDCKLVLVFHDKNGEHRQSERERDRKRKRQRQRQRDRDRKRQIGKERERHQRNKE